MRSTVAKGKGKGKTQWSMSYREITLGKVPTVAISAEFGQTKFLGKLPVDCPECHNFPEYLVP